MKKRKQMVLLVFSVPTIILSILLLLALVFKWFPWVFPAILLLLISMWFMFSFFESDIDTHYYVTLFGKNMGVIPAGDGLHIIPLLLFETDPIITETIEDSFPGKEEDIIFSSDEENVDIPEGKVKTYRITTNGKNVPFTDPEDINNEDIKKEVIELHKHLNEEIQKYEQSKSDNDPLEKRLTLEPRFLVKYRMAADFTTEESLAISAEQFFKKFSSMTDLRNAIGVTTYDILANIFGKVTPGTLVAFQELISKLVHLRLKGIYDDKGVQIIHFGLANPGIPHELSSKISNAAEAIAEKDKKVIEAEAESKSSLLKENARLDITERQNKIELSRKQKEVEIAGVAKFLLYEAEAKGVTELAKSLELKSDQKIIIKQLETLKDALKDNNFNIIMNTGGSNFGGFQDLFDLAKIKMLENKKTENE